MTKTDTVETLAALATEFIAFDRACVPCVLGQIRWTNSHRFFRVLARLVKVNEKSVRAEILEDIHDFTMRDGKLVQGRVLYPAGHIIRAPRFVNDEYSENNGFFSVPDATVVVRVDGTLNESVSWEFRGADARTKAEAKASELRKRYAENNRTDLTTEVLDAAQLLAAKGVTL